MLSTCNHYVLFFDRFRSIFTQILYFFSIFDLTVRHGLKFRNNGCIIGSTMKRHKKEEVTELKKYDDSNGRPMLVKYRDKRGVVQYRKLTGKMRKWLECYLDVDGEGFMNVTKSAQLAGYQGDWHSLQVSGSRCKKELMPVIEGWLEESGLGGAELKRKLFELVNATRTKWFSNEGVVTDSRKEKALEVQLRALELALKVTGVLKDDRATEVNVTGAKGVTVEVKGLSAEALTELERVTRGEGEVIEGEWTDVDWEEEVNDEA